MNIRHLLSKLEFSDDIKYNKTFSIVTYTVLCLVASFMTLLNIITHKGFLTACTAVFAFLCVINIMLALSGEILLRISKILFSIEVVLMFTFFLVSGNPEGFSAIWICMLPSLGMFFFDRTRGSIICGFMLVIMIFFLWTDIGNGYLMYQYTDSFKMRFPVLFIAFYALAFLLETLRSNAYSSMKKMREYYQDLSIRDQLTGMFNRQGMYSELEKRAEYATGSKIGIAMFDIDFFKSVNDTYGHNVGDLVLKEVAKTIKSNLDSVVCRWGGEEFVAIFLEKNVTPDDLENVRKIIEEKEFTDENEKFGITISIGVCEKAIFEVEKIDKLIEAADTALYQAKETGRNKIIYYEKKQINC